MTDSPRRRRPGILSSLFCLGLLGVAAAGGYWVWQSDRDRRTIAEQQRIIDDLSTKLDRAWARELAADLRVHRIVRDLKSGTTEMDVSFIQYAPGSELPVLEKRFTLLGEEIYVDALVIRFERALVERGDGLRGKSLLLFRRAFGDEQKPTEGISLYRGDGESSLVPELLQVDDQPSSFEKDLWNRFWTLANDPDAARQAGVTVAQGEAPHVRAVEGQVYKLTLRASGGLEITPRLPAAVLAAPQRP